MVNNAGSVSSKLAGTLSYLIDVIDARGRATVNHQKTHSKNGLKEHMTKDLN
ncbi:MAG: hypothetical protein M3270_03955 [Thermoproteota archaeon]|nr:hypothetical protein [Thermoproteota archaeon]